MNSTIEVRRIGKSMGVFTKASIAKGDTILFLKGLLTDKPSRYSIQLNNHFHLEVPEGELTIFTDEYLWKFLNHCCDPNAMVETEEKRLIAIKDISAGEEICFNYNTTEYELAAPFECFCNHHVVLVKGYKYLSPA